MLILRREGSRQMIIKWGMRTGWIDHFIFFFGLFILKYFFFGSIDYFYLK